MMRTLQILKKIPGVRTEMDGIEGISKGVEEAMPFMDVLTYHDGPQTPDGGYNRPLWETYMDRLERMGKRVWFYNIDTTGYRPEIMRFGYGFHIARSRAQGAFCWAYQWPSKSPYEDPREPHGFSFMYSYPTFGSETGGPSTGWEGIREGVDDYRYCLTYLKAAEAARAAGNQDKLKIVAETDRELKDALAKITYDQWKHPECQARWTGGPCWTGGKRSDEHGVMTYYGKYKLPNGWTFDDYNRLRRLLADAIVQLQK